MKHGVSWTMLVPLLFIIFLASASGLSAYSGVVSVSDYHYEAIMATSTLSKAAFLQTNCSSEVPGNDFCLLLDLTF